MIRQTLFGASHFRAFKAGSFVPPDRRKYFRSKQLSCPSCLACHFTRRASRERLRGLYSWKQIETRQLESLESLTESAEAARNPHREPEVVAPFFSSVSQVNKVLEDANDDYNLSHTAQMNLVFFQDRLPRCSQWIPRLFRRAPR